VTAASEQRQPSSRMAVSGAPDHKGNVWRRPTSLN